MTQQETYSDSARVAYDAFAPKYDEFNAQNNYEVWLGEVLLPELEKHGLGRGRVLDVGCGTGKAFPSLLSRGWKVYGCDVSTEMLNQARGKFGATTVHLSEIDARALRLLSVKPFDLILLLNDVVNYLTEDGDLERCFSGVARNLAPKGLVCFDANCMRLYEANWVAGRDAALRDRGLDWVGLTDRALAGGIFEARVSAPDVEPRVHRQRHWTREQVEGAMDAVGLRCLAARGHSEDEARRVLLSEDPDEFRDLKTIYIGGHRE